MTEQDPELSAPRRFPLLDDPEPAPKRLWRRRAVVALCLAAVGGAVGLLTLRGTEHSTSSLPVPTERPAAQLPAGTRPFPGVTGRPAQSIGIVGPATTEGVITKAQALRGYDRIAGVASRAHRRVLVALARVAYLQQGRVRQGDFWIVSVWFHPGFAGAGPSAWCVDHGLVKASNGQPSGHVYACPLSPGTRPRPLR